MKNSPATSERDLAQFHREYIKEYMEQEHNFKSRFTKSLNEQKKKGKVVLIPLDQALKQLDN